MQDDNSQTGLILSLAIGIAMMAACGAVTLVMTGIAWQVF